MAKKTPLFDEHKALGATIVEFGGWDMPVQYSAVIEEHTATREHAGLFDTSHMGELFVSGGDSRAFLQSLLTNDIGGLSPGCAVYAVLTNEKGGCVDDLWVYMLDDNKYMLCVNASRTDADFEWIAARAGGDVAVENRSGEYGMVALQGPAAIAVFDEIASAPAPRRFCFNRQDVAGVETLVSRTGYTGEDGVELYCPAAETPALWRALLEAGTPRGLKPTGLGARDTLRLEACYSLYGHEINEDTTPVEAGIGFAVAREKNFPGCEFIYRQMDEGTDRKIAAFELTSRGVPRENYGVAHCGEEVGVVTSGCFSPTLRKGIGLAMLNSNYAVPGTDVEIIIRGRAYAARIVKRPFIKFRGEK